MRDDFDRIGKTVEEILSTRDELIDQLAAAYYMATSIPPEAAALVMENTESGVRFYFVPNGQYAKRH